MTLLGSAIALRARMEDKAERARLLYVAMTRPRDRLIMIGSSSALTPNMLIQKPNTLHGEACAVWEAQSMLEWVCQTIQNYDDIQVLEGDQLFTDILWKTPSLDDLSTESTFFPHKRVVWHVVFHMNATKFSNKEYIKLPPGEKSLQEVNQHKNRLQALLKSLPHHPACGEKKENPPFRTLSSSFFSEPLKIGVTAFCRNLDEAEKTFITVSDVEAESIVTKRFPFSFTGPRKLSDLPALPAFLRGDEPQTALLKGIATHKVLSLIPFPLIQKTIDISSFQNELSQSLRSILTKSISLLQENGLLMKEEASLVQIEPLMKFFCCPLGRRALSSKKIHREWNFNLLAPDLCESILQGVIDLCFLEDDSWVLVDFKTDQVSSPQALHFLYARQVEIYRRALIEGTGLPVKESFLFSLNLGGGYLVP